MQFSRLSSFAKAAIIIAIACLLWVLVISPPKTACDSVSQAFQSELQGSFLGQKIDKKYFPPTFKKSAQSCFKAMASGACYEYQQHLKNLLDRMLGRSEQCRADLLEISLPNIKQVFVCEKNIDAAHCDDDQNRLNLIRVEAVAQKVQTILEDALGFYVQKSWFQGDWKDGKAQRLSLSEYEFSLFCRIKKIIFDRPEIDTAPIKARLQSSLNVFQIKSGKASVTEDLNKPMNLLRYRCPN